MHRVLTQLFVFLLLFFSFIVTFYQNSFIGSVRVTQDMHAGAEGQQKLWLDFTGPAQPR